jgi:hypothetical protein
MGISLENTCELKEVLFIGSEAVNITTNYLNHLTPNDHYSGRTAPLTSRSCILNIYSTNIRTEYFNMLHYLRFSLFKMPFIS